MKLKRNNSRHQRERDIALLQTYPLEKRQEIARELYLKYLEPKRINERILKTLKEFHIEHYEGGGWRNVSESLINYGEDKTYEFFKTLLGKRKNETENFFPYSTEFAKFLTRITFIDWYSSKDKIRNEKVLPFVEDHLDRLGHPRTNLATVIGRKNLEEFQNSIWNNLSIKEREKRINETGGHPYFEDRNYHDKSEQFKQDLHIMDFIGTSLDQISNLAMGLIKSSKFRSEVYEKWSEELGIPLLDNGFLDSLAYGDVRSCLKYNLAENNPAFKRKYPQNPFLPLINIYEKGIIPLAIYDGKFAIFHPE